MITDHYFTPESHHEQLGYQRCQWRNPFNDAVCDQGFYDHIDMEHPSGSELHTLRIEALRKMQRAITLFDCRNTYVVGVYDPELLDALNAISDYSIARMRWMDDHR